MTKQKQNSVQRSTIEGRKPWFVQTSENESECQDYASRSQAREAARALRNPAPVAVASSAPVESPQQVNP